MEFYVVYVLVPFIWIDFNHSTMLLSPLLVLSHPYPSTIPLVSVRFGSNQFDIFVLKTSLHFLSIFFPVILNFIMILIFQFFVVCINAYAYFVFGDWRHARRCGDYGFDHFRAVTLIRHDISCGPTKISIFRSVLSFTSLVEVCVWYVLDHKACRHCRHRHSQCNINLDFCNSKRLIVLIWY